jgi:hypothetical protein
VEASLVAILIAITLWVAAFLCMLNAVFAVFFRRRRIPEVLCYVFAGLIELFIFGFALFIRMGILTHVPYHLPPNLPFNRAEIGAALAVGIGLFPAAYWHRTSVAQIRERMARDAKVMKQRDASVRVRSNTPGEWMN